jgi:hypothetical protein
MEEMRKREGRARGEDKEKKRENDYELNKR